MAGNRDERDRRVAKRQRLPFREHEVALRLHGIRVRRVRRRRRRIHHVPIRRRQPDLRAVVLLKIRRAAEVIAVSVSDEDVLDVGRIEPERLQSRDDFRLDAIRITGIDQDDPLRSSTIA